MKLYNFSSKTIVETCIVTLCSFCISTSSIMMHLILCSFERQYFFFETVLFQPKQNAPMMKHLSCFSLPQSLSAVCAPSQQCRSSDTTSHKTSSPPCLFIKVWLTNSSLFCINSGYRLWLGKTAKTFHGCFIVLFWPTQQFQNSVAVGLGCCIHNKLAKSLQRRSLSNMY